MILSLKVLAAAGLAASVATGGAIATHTPTSNPPAAATAGSAAAPAVDDGGHENGDDDTTTSTVTDGAVTSATPPAPTVSVQSAGDAGTVTLSINRGKLTITDVQTNDGWVVETQRAAGREAKVSFRNGLRHIDFKAEFAAGQLKTRVRERTLESEDTPAATTPTTPTTVEDRDHDDDRITTPTTPTTFEDRIDRDDDDHSGPGGGGEDHSGPGRGGDDR